MRPVTSATRSPARRRRPAARQVQRLCSRLTSAQVGVGGVRLDPGQRDRLGLSLDVADGREVDPCVGVERPAGLDLELDRARRRCRARPSPVTSAGRSPAAYSSTPGRLGGRLGAQRQQAAEGIPRRRKSAAEVELARRPTVPELAQALEQSRRSASTPARHNAGSALWRPRWSMSPGDVELRVGDLRRGDREQVLGRDAGLVALHRVADRDARPATSPMARRAGQSGRKRRRTVARIPSRAATAARALELGAAVERDPHAAPDRALEQRSPFIGPLSEIVRGRSRFAAPPRARPGRRRHSRCPPALRIRRRARQELALIEGRSRNCARPSAAESVLEPARVSAQLVLGDDVERECRTARPAPRRAAVLDEEARRRGPRGSRRAASPRGVGERVCPVSMLYDRTVHMYTAANDGSPPRGRANAPIRDQRAGDDARRLLVAGDPEADRRARGSTPSAIAPSPSSPSVSLGIDDLLVRLAPGHAAGGARVLRRGPRSRPYASGSRECSASGSRSRGSSTSSRPSCCRSSARSAGARSPSTRSCRRRRAARARGGLPRVDRGLGGGAGGGLRLARRAATPRSRRGCSWRCSTACCSDQLAAPDDDVEEH